MLKTQVSSSNINCRLGSLFDFSQVILRHTTSTISSSHCSSLLFYLSLFFLPSFFWLVWFRYFYSAAADVASILKNVIRKFCISTDTILSVQLLYYVVRMILLFFRFCPHSIANKQEEALLHSFVNLCVLSPHKTAYPYVYDVSI